MEDFQSKYSGEQVEEFLDQIANGEISGGSSVYKWNWNSEMNGTFTEEEFEKLSNADVVYITTGVADMEMLYSVDGRAVVEDALHLGVHILSFETDTDNSEAANVESITFIFDNASKTWSAQGGDAELITNEQLTSALEDKQDKITDLDTIRSGAEKGATALQSVPSEYVTESELTNKGYATTSALNNKVDKVSGKQLSTEDFTTALKSKLEGLNNYDDTELSNALSILRGDFDKLVSGDTTTAIKTFNEIIAFLDGVQDSQNLSSIIASIEQQIAGKMDKVTLATVATSGSYNDLEDKPTIPVAVTESTVSGWGFTKNTGTYSKPSGGIPKSDLDSATQQVLTTAFGDHQTIEDMSIDISDLRDEMSNTAVTQQYGEEKVAKDIDGFITRRQTVYALPDAAGGAEDDVIATANTLKTINGQSIVGSGNLIIEGGSTDGFVTKVKVGELDVANTQALYDDNTVYALPTSANGDEDDILLSRNSVKTINGESILGSGDIEISGSGGGGSAGVYITPFTVEQFCSRYVELTDEQCNELSNAALQNRVIGMPYDIGIGSHETGYIITDYRYSSSYELGNWSLRLGIIYNGAHYSNSIYSYTNNFIASGATITPFKTLTHIVPVEDGRATVSDNFGYTDNCIFWVEGECTELYIYLEPSEIGKTVRFFTGESCTLEFISLVYWANGEVPTIEPYTHYELSLVTNMEGIFNAVLTPFKSVE